MCALINEVDTVVTLKLHVGAIAASLGKSVIAFPVHWDKVHNFYRSINEIDRCVHISKINKKIVYDQLIKYYDKPIKINENTRKKADKYYDILNKICKGML